MHSILYDIRYTYSFGISLFSYRSSRNLEEPGYRSPRNLEETGYRSSRNMEETVKVYGEGMEFGKTGLRLLDYTTQKIWIYKFLDLKNLGTSNFLDELNTRGTPDKIMNWTLRKVLPDELTNRILAKGNITRRNYK
ncbi:unnamed protein product [Rhizophagus irregularis]|nr:unnamed protein product [Rhizophagus irregularis]